MLWHPTCLPTPTTNRQWRCYIPWPRCRSPRLRSTFCVGGHVTGSIWNNRGPKNTVIYLRVCLHACVLLYFYQFTSPSLCCGLVCCSHVLRLLCSLSLNFFSLPSLSLPFFLSFSCVLSVMHNFTLSIECVYISIFNWKEKNPLETQVFIVTS